MPGKTAVASAPSRFGLGGPGGQQKNFVQLRRAATNFFSQAAIWLAIMKRFGREAT
jgi:hypothetical protein